MHARLLFAVVIAVVLMLRLVPSAAEPYFLAKPTPDPLRPSWAIQKPPTPPSRSKLQRGDWERNRKIVSDANERRLKYDVVFWGDSITAFMGRDRTILDEQIGNRAVALGVGGDTIEHLAGRLMTSEKFVLAPTHAIFRIGINNFLRNKQSVDAVVRRMDQFLDFVRRLMPSTRIYLMPLLRTTRDVNTTSANTGLKRVASRHGATWLDCGARMDPADSKLFADGVHPTAAGHRRILECVRTVLA